MMSHLLLAIIGTFAVIVGAQKQEGFISLDCGFPIEESPYSDPSTGLTFTSDSTFIQTGESGRVDKELNKIFRKPYLTLRYFPEGKRNCSLRNSFRVHCSTSDSEIRYDDDSYDRVWYPFFSSSFSYITTSLNINNSDTFEIPKAALKSAATPKNASAPLIITWKPRPSNAEVYFYLHFAEIQTLAANETREFDIVFKGNFNYSAFSPTKLELLTFFTSGPVQCDSDGCNLQLVRTPNSTLPPLINALEAYTIIEFPQLETSLSDVNAIKNIKATYRLSKTSWQGDPCLPQELSWENLRCSYTNSSTPPKIISLNLSASGLTGSLPSVFQNLTQIQELDLSNNSLTGLVPSFLANIKSLSLLDLSGNNFTGSVPQTLLDREKEGLVLKLEGNPELCKFSSCNPKKKKGLLVPVIASISSVLIVIVVVALFFVLRKKKMPSDAQAPPSLPVEDVGQAKHSESSFVSKKIRFAYFEVQEMTNNFQRVLGEGGFGVVYHGCVNGTQQVAVKLLSQSSSQGYKHFKAEVELLMRVHHKNLVSLVGYCDEGDHLALIYEYMPNGDLKQHLSGKRGGFVLSWESRLRVAVDAALGLEYLHTGCKPPMVHRDIKSTNILLDERFQAKLADFGLSRSFPTENETHVSTVVAGTPGYLDPEYYQTNWLTEKSDVYSFGIVLLEIITNRPIIQQSREKPHLVEWVGFIVRTGDIGNIVDPNLHGAYDVGSVWKAIELAMSCVNISSARRPSMSQVVSDLKECVISENSRTGESREMNSMSSIEFSMGIDTEVIPKAR
ncbi:Leucine-rich repeat protein kinase family protein [Arabidopsis thaliana]|uniref:non-specific serine/threonine protein kinase n=1 Tax=Arabidopsis thaliana TaxID=3702 RepID=O81067_ARATH|nr:Leucine-rich repeat protein kinase family protein [Arabidopsis thaliana]AAC33225.1 putative receptor-like protein kinase [Arabidopsis thaliana]AEC08196.1 Leucine-rich repeat protein kinase family protein [Arabidopsis thaliana]|eukprot:NP_180463.1 Leucine-rich repeat protein kinase family protein [Arabidopsis thaliana]